MVEKRWWCVEKGSDVLKKRLVVVVEKLVKEIYDIKKATYLWPKRRRQRLLGHFHSCGCCDGGFVVRSVMLVCDINKMSDINSKNDKILV